MRITMMITLMIIITMTFTKLIDIGLKCCEFSNIWNE